MQVLYLRTSVEPVTAQADKPNAFPYIGGREVDHTLNCGECIMVRIVVIAGNVSNRGNRTGDTSEYLLASFDGAAPVVQQVSNDDYEIDLRSLDADIRNSGRRQMGIPENEELHCTVPRAGYCRGFAVAILYWIISIAIFLESSVTLLLEHDPDQHRGHTYTRSCETVWISMGADVVDIIENKRMGHEADPTDDKAHPSGVEGYEPVLQVVVEGSTEKVEDGFNPRYVFKPTGRPEFRLFGPHTGNYIDDATIMGDERLRKLLTTQIGHAQRSIRYPSASAVQRRFINPDTDIIDDNEFIQEASAGYQLLRSVLMRYVLKFHEYGSSDSPNGHFMTLNHPEEAAFGYMLPFSQIPAVLNGQQVFSRALPTMYHEFPAFLEERRVLSELIEADSPFEDICSVISVSPAERETLKQTDLDVLDETVRALSEWYIAPDDYSEVGRNTQVLRTIDWLEEEVGRDRALDALNVPREATMHPDKWVCHLLHDVAAGRNVDDIRTDGSYWETRAGGGTYDEASDLTDRQRKNAVENPWKRGFYTTHESIQLSTDRLVRTWYSYQPDSSFSIEHIRYRLFLQELFSNSTLRRDGKEWDIEMIGKTNTPARLKRKDEETNRIVEQQPFHYAKYHVRGENPFELARTGATTPTDIGTFFDYEQNGDLSWEAWNKSRKDALRQMAFDENELTEALKWVQSGEHSDL